MILKCSAYSEQRCRSCSTIEIDYEIGLASKVKILGELFPEMDLTEVIKNSTASEYRNKAKFIIAGSLKNPVVGIPSPTDKFMASELLDCPIHEKELNEIALFIKSRISEFLLTPYDLLTKKGEFKYLIITQSNGEKEISVRFGMRSSESLPRVGKLSKFLTDHFPSIKVISFEIQPKHAAIFDGETSYISDEKFIVHKMNDYKLLSSTTSFFQVNSKIAEKLYQRVYKEYQDKKIKIALDLFCGVGGFSFELSKFSNNVIGIELSENAIECANASLLLNNFKNIKFICDDAYNFKKYLEDNQCDLITVNPPRRGIGEKFCHLINEINPRFLVYSSCNPETLKTDSEILKDNYKLIKMIPVDMFALTNHLEVLTFWERINSPS